MAGAVNGGFGVQAVGFDGGAPTTLASDPNADDIVVGPNYLYWSDGSRIMKVGLDGGTPVTLSSEWAKAGDLAVDSTSVYWIVAGSAMNGFVMKSGHDGGPVFVLAPDKDGASGLATDGTNVYWLGNGSVEKIAASGGTPEALLSSGVSGGAPEAIAATRGEPVAPYYIAVDAHSVYWADSRGIMKLTPK